jgi:hypothetical protein
VRKVLIPPRTMNVINSIPDFRRDQAAGLIHSPKVSDVLRAPFGRRFEGRCSTSAASRQTHHVPCAREPADPGRARAMAAREARPDQSEDEARRSDPLHAVTLGRGSPASSATDASRSTPIPSSGRSARSRSNARTPSSRALTAAPSTGPSSLH